MGGDDEEQQPHLHGYLFVSIDGDPLSFTDPKYLIGESDRVGTTFHFHDHDEPNRWHMEGKQLVLAAALDALPDVEYRTAGGAHVLQINGTTYDASDPTTDIAISNRDGPIDPTRYRLKNGDVISIEITTEMGG